MVKFKIGILETGRPPEALATQYGSYPNMVKNWLSHIEGEVFTYSVLDGEFPKSADICDLWVITGSKFGCYDDHYWIKALETFIRDIKSSGKLMFGICFGHQLIARALGGTVEKHSKGWALGINQYKVQNWPSELGTEPAQIAIQAYHQDQITKLPKGAINIASSDFCKFAAVWYPGFGLTVQGHPEFTTEYASDLIECRRGTSLTDDEVDRALANKTDVDNRAFIANIVKTYLISKGRTHA